MFVDDPGSERPTPGTTGKYLLLMREDALEEGVRTLRDAAGLTVAASSDFDDGAVEGETLAEAEAIVFEDWSWPVGATDPERPPPDAPLVGRGHRARSSPLARRVRLPGAGRMSAGKLSATV
jgi:hypothetical protein